MVIVWTTLAMELFMMLYTSFEPCGYRQDFFETCFLILWSTKNRLEPFYKFAGWPHKDNSCVVLLNRTNRYRRSCLNMSRGRQWSGIFHFYWWTTSIKPRLLFAHAGFASWGLLLLPGLFYIILSYKQIVSSYNSMST